ncbi:MAG: hypothetical protein ACRENL_01820, partial [Candidatus Dormibacteria bacterium]
GRNGIDTRVLIGGEQVLNVTKVAVMAEAGGITRADITVVGADMVFAAQHPEWIRGLTACSHCGGGLPQTTFSIAPPDPED